ncbi:MAG: YraN family protein [Alphaproteobacteria bacterium]
MPEGRRTRERRGRRAETLAAAFLLMKGYRIVARRYRTPSGEIDLVVRRGGTVAFVEVRGRADRDTAAAAIAARQQRRITAAAAFFVSAHPWAAALVHRLNAALIVPGRWPRHVIDAWRESAS